MKVKSLSCVQLLATPWTAAYQAPPSMGFSRQEYWSGVPLPSPNQTKTNIQAKLSFCIRKKEALAEIFLFHTIHFHIPDLFPYYFQISHLLISNRKKHNDFRSYKFMVHMHFIFIHCSVVYSLSCIYKFNQNIALQNYLNGINIVLSFSCIFH